MMTNSARGLILLIALLAFAIGRWAVQQELSPKIAEIDTLLEGKVCVSQETLLSVIGAASDCDCSGGTGEIRIEPLRTNGNCTAPVSRFDEECAETAPREDVQHALFCEDGECVEIGPDEIPSVLDLGISVITYGCAYSTWDGESCNCAAPDEWFERECR